MAIPPKSDREWVRTLGMFGVIVADFVGLTVAGVAAGYLAWKELGAPWWTVIPTGLTGMALAIYRLVLLSRKMDRDSGGPE